jgi:Sphingolipid Delta4-desaturase (DES)
VAAAKSAGMVTEPVSTVTEQQQEDEEQRDFHWTDTAEPHSARRRAMLQKYGPQIRALYGNDPWTAYQVRGCS